MTDNNKKENTVEGFLYMVAMSLILMIIPIFKNIDFNIWIKTIIALVITLISHYLIKITTRHLKSKITLNQSKLFLIYISYFVLYFVIRVTLKI